MNHLILYGRYAFCFDRTAAHRKTDKLNCGEHSQSETATFERALAPDSGDDGGTTAKDSRAAPGDTIAWRAHQAPLLLADGRQSKAAGLLPPFLLDTPHNRPS